MAGGSCDVDVENENDDVDEDVEREPVWALYM